MPQKLYSCIVLFKKSKLLQSYLRKFKAISVKTNMYKYITFMIRIVFTLNLSLRVLIRRMMILHNLSFSIFQFISLHVFHLTSSISWLMSYWNNLILCFLASTWYSIVGFRKPPCLNILVINFASVFTMLPKQIISLNLRNISSLFVALRIKMILYNFL